MTDYTKESRFKVTTVAWKNHSLDDSYEIEYSGGWMVSHWNDDETSSKGLCLLTNYKTSKGNIVSVETVISKDNLIKALALLVDEEEDES
jgi:hypothetical protein